MEEASHEKADAESEPPPPPGMPGQDVWAFKALKAGESTICLDYSQPWEGGDQGRVGVRLERGCLVGGVDMGASLQDDGSREPSDSAIEVAIGAHVEVELIAVSGENEHLAFDIVPDAEADFSAGFLGVGTPLVRAMLGRRAGSVVSYQVGDITQVRILTVGVSSRAPANDVTADRRAVIQRAIAKSDLADAVRFALTVDQKWGDTDPEGIASNWEAASGEDEQDSP